MEMMEMMGSGQRWMCCGVERFAWQSTDLPYLSGSLSLVLSCNAPLSSLLLFSLPFSSSLPLVSFPLLASPFRSCLRLLPPCVVAVSSSPFQLRTTLRKTEQRRKHMQTRYRRRDSARSTGAEHAFLSIHIYIETLLYRQPWSH
eukprot:m.51334 g.51334  ORF g.51334 m.51334 type:complete len:144 (-) comp12616_c0_seq2:238-669(-)